MEQTRYSPDAAKHALANNPFSGQLFDGEIIHASGLNAGVPLSAINHGRPLVLIDACEETPTFDTVNFPNEDGARAQCSISSNADATASPLSRRVFATNRTGARGKFQRFASTRGQRRTA